jgi:hypothetical protein
VTTYTLGVNCHLTLQHDSVNLGAPYGFILHPDSANEKSGPAVSIQKSIDSDGGIIVRVFFSVLLADGLVNPDGSRHADSRADMYAMILAYLAEDNNLTLTCPAGIVSNLCSLGHVSTEHHYGDHSLIICQLTDLAVYYPPAPPALFNISVWDGTLTWSTSYWRTTAITPPPMAP